MMKRIIFWVTVTCLTLRTPNWIKNTFSKLCQLDLSRPIDTPWGELEASCSTVIFRAMNGGGFVMSETPPSPMYVKMPSNDGWVEVYRDGVSIEVFEWVHMLKSIHAYLSSRGIYLAREEECLIDSSLGIM